MNDATAKTDPLATFEASGKFDDYQAVAHATAIYPGAPDCLLYPVFGLVDEACEVADKTLQAWLKQDPAAAGLPVYALQAAVHLGQLMGQIKKAWRDDAGGEMNMERRKAADEAANQLRFRVADMLMTLRFSSKVPIAFPTITFSTADLDAYVKELGDPYWYLAEICTTIVADMGRVASVNLRKLSKRAEVGTLHGSGDDR